MKKTLLLITAAALVCSGNAMAEDQPQIPNGDFETWNYDGENLPDNWNSFQTADGNGLLLAFAYDSKNRQVKRSTDKHPGSKGQYSCSIWSRSAMGVAAQGNLTTGRVHVGNMSATHKDNYNYSDRDGSNTNNGVTNPCAMKFTGKPKAVKVWVKYKQAGGNYDNFATAKFSAIIHSNADYISYGLSSNDPEDNKALVVASAVQEIPYTGGGWVELIIPYEYTNNGATPAYIQINASTNAYPGKGKVNDYLYIDDIVMIYDAAYAVMEKIDAIGEVAYDDASKEKIDAARTAYDALTAEEKTQVPDAKIAVLTTAEAKYAELKQAAADKAAADAAVEKINAIGEVEYTDDSKALIDAARTAYDGLTDAQKALVTKETVAVLTDAEAKYAELKQAAEEAAAQAEADKKAADAAITSINAIGTVEYTEASKEKIDAARTAYDALTDAQKALVTKETLAVLTDAEKTYADLKQAADEAAAQAEADKKAADAAVDKINAIGTVEYTEASKEKIDVARAAYNALTDAQKALVTKETVAVLTAAEAKYAELKQAAEEAAAQAEADKKAADAAIASINAIGEVEYTDDSKALIDAARAAYNNLTDAQKALVTAADVKVLTDAETKYAELKQAAEEAAAQAAADKAAADAAIAKINAIGTVEYTDASKAKIDAARAAYDALTDAQKALVTKETLAVLTDAETKYAELKQAAEEAAAQAEADKKAADAAVEKINAIGTVEYTDASKAKIDAARTAYDALTDAQKALVTAADVKVLTDAEAKYAELEEQAKKEATDKAAAENAITHINTIGTVAYTGESKQKIDAARAAYNNLTDAQKALVSADVVKVLTDAEAAYAQLEQAADQAAKDKTAADAAIAKINAIGTVEYSDASKAKIDAAREAYDALTDAQKALVTASDLAKLTSAETKYAELKQQAEEAAQQAEQAAKELAEAKTALGEGISEAKKYYESIKADYAGVAATLQAAINAAAEVLNSATVTKAQADDAKAALAAAVKKAQDDVTVITGISTAKSEAGTADVWYDMNGRRLPGKPTTKGLYIRNGKKVAM